MDWSNEKYVKLYQRVTDDDLCLSWEARALWHEMLRRFDRSGVITTKRGALGLALQVNMPIEVVERVLPELENDGRVCRIDTGWCAPNFVDAQDARKNDRLRQQELREKRRLEALNGRHVTDRDASVTNRDDSSRAVTPSHGASRTRHSPDQTRLDETRRDERAHARAISCSPDGRRDDGVIRYEPLSFNPKRFHKFVDEKRVGLVEFDADGSEIAIEP